MPNKVPNRTKVKINGKSIPIDNYYLNALSLKYFNAPYQDEEIRYS